MEIAKFIDTAIEFSKDKLDKARDFWDGLSEDKKKLYIGCAIAAVTVIVIASIAYSLGKSRGERIAFEEEDF